MDLIIQDLHVSVGNKKILNGLNLTMKPGEVHAIMGPNGTGKSTLLNTIMGHPKYTVESGKILLDGENILEMSVDERSRKGIFLAFQYPMEVSGVTNSDFVKTALQKQTGKPVGFAKFFNEFETAIKDLKMRPDLAHRYLNEGFSGGEKKRNEILQMKVLKPKYSFLDEIDSGLDVDALKIVSENVNSLIESGMGCLLVTHYQRLLDYIKPQFVHIMLNGTIVKTGGEELINRIDTFGYDWIKNELGIEDEYLDKEDIISIGSCATKEALDNK